MTGAGRLGAIDWLRGVAVASMVLWHVVDAWHTQAGRESPAFAAVIFAGGWAAPMFVFLAGVSLPLAAEKHVARGVSRRQAARWIRRRGWQIFGLAHLFRLQSFLLDPYARWDALFKADILNVLGLGIVLTGWVWRLADSDRRRYCYLLLPALVVGLVLTPWTPLWQWPSLLPSRLEGYIRVAGDNAVFSLFPAVGYVLAGAFVGTGRAVAALRNDSLGRLAWTGLALAALPLLWGLLPLPEAVLRWTGHLAVAVFRVGAMVALLALGGWLLRGGSALWTPVVTLGKASLFAYWVHVEPVYGVFSEPLHGALSLGWALAGWLAVLTATGAGAAWWLAARPRRPFIPVHMVAPGRAWAGRT